MQQRVQWRNEAMSIALQFLAGNSCLFVASRSPHSRADLLPPVLVEPFFVSNYNISNYPPALPLQLLPPGSPGFPCASTRLSSSVLALALSKTGQICVYLSCQTTRHPNLHPLMPLIRFIPPLHKRKRKKKEAPASRTSWTSTASCESLRRPLRWSSISAREGHCLLCSTFIRADEGPCARHASRALRRACGQGAVLSLCMVRLGSGRFGVGFWVGFWVGLRARDFPTGECSPGPP